MVAFCKLPHVEKAPWAPSPSWTECTDTGECTPCNTSDAPTMSASRSRPSTRRPSFSSGGPRSRGPGFRGGRVSEYRHPASPASPASAATSSCCARQREVLGSSCRASSSRNTNQDRPPPWPTKWGCATWPVKRTACRLPHRCAHLDRGAGLLLARALADSGPTADGRLACRVINGLIAINQTWDLPDRLSAEEAVGRSCQTNAVQAPGDAMYILAGGTGES